MNDSELLELTAKAAYLKFEWWVENDRSIYRESDGHPVYWNPLTDDGDALRLAVKCKIFRCHMDLFHRFYEEAIADGADEDRATRRAIVRAAAEIGKAMK